MPVRGRYFAADELAFAAGFSADDSSGTHLPSTIW